MEVTFNTELMDTETPAPSPFGLMDIQKRVPAPVSPAAAGIRADKASFGLGANSPGAQAIAAAMQEGRSPEFQQQTANMEQLRQEQNKMNLIQQLSRMSGESLTPDEQNLIRSIPRIPTNVDPNIVLEHLYGQRVVNMARTSAMMNDVLEAYQGRPPRRVDDSMSISQNLVTNHATVVRIEQEMTERFEQQGFGTKTWSFLGTLVPFLANYRMHDPRVGQVMPGANLRDHIQNLYQQSPTNFERAVRTEAERIFAANPFMGMDYLKAVREMTTDRAFVQDMWSLFDVATLSPMAGGKRIIGGAGMMTQYDLHRMIAANHNLVNNLYPAYVRGNSAGRGFMDDIVSNVELASRRPGFGQTPRDFGRETESILGSGRGLVDDANATGFIYASTNPTRYVGPNGANLVTSVERLAQDMTMAAGLSEKFRPEYISAVLNQPRTAAVVAVAREIAETQAGHPPTDMETFTNRLHGVLNISNVSKNPGTIAAEITTRVSNLTHANADKLTRALDDGVRVQYPPETIQAAFKETTRTMNEFYTHPSSAVIRFNYNWDRKTNSHFAEMFLGTPKAELFSSQASAGNAARTRYKLNPGNYEVVQEGAGWAIKVRDPINMTTHDVFDHLLTTANTTTVSPLNMFLGALRTSQSLLSYFNREARNVTTHGTTALNSVIKEVASSIGQLSKAEHKNMSRFFALDRDFERNGQIGRFFDTVGEFEQEYRRLFFRVPTEKEIKAYFSYRQISDFDYDVRNLSLYRDMSRLGIKQHRFRVTQMETDLEPKKVLYTPYFNGRVVAELPHGNAGVFFQDSSTHNGQYFRLHELGANPALKKMVDEAFENGHKIIQVFNSTERPLHGLDYVKGHGGDFINYVIAKDIGTLPLPHNMIPYRPGGHREYGVQHFVKQAVLSRSGGRHNYEGDITILGQESAAEVTKHAAALNTAREMLRDNRIDELKAFLPNNLPEEMQFGRFQKYFRDHGGQWDLNEPFYATPNHKSTLDMAGLDIKKRYPDFHNEHDSGHNLMSQIDRSFLGQRDPQLWTIKERGSESHPLIELEGARLIDPLATLSRTVTNAANARVVSDYKYLSAQTWVQQFSKVIDAPSVEHLQTNPLYYLLQGEFKKGVDPELLATAKWQRASIKNFLNLDSPDIRQIKYMQNKLLDGIYNKFGQPASDRYAEHLLSGETDPSRYVRGIAFHSKLGLFNLPQFFVQAHAAIHSIAVAGPVRGIQGVAGATLNTMLRFTENPAILATFDRMAAKFGWKQGDLIMSREGLRRSGWDLVQGEAAWADDVRDPKLFRSGLGRVLDAGAVFFREGEKLSRSTAWFTAFSEWRRANKAATSLTDRDIAQIMTRADLLNVNMTRASQAVAQAGLGSIPVQFLTYTKHLTEQVLGGVVGAGRQAVGLKNNARLTPVETARAIATYSAMYGAPIGMGVAVGLWPFHDSIRQAAMENGYDVQNPLFQMIVEGIPSWAMTQLTGREYNYAARMGPQMTTFRDFLNGDKKWWEMLGGVSASVIADIADPVWSGIRRGITEGGLMEDLVDATREVSALSTAVRSVMAWNYGKYYTKRETVVTDVDRLDAVLMGTFGVTPQSVADTFLKQNSLRLQQQAQREAGTIIRNEIKHGLEAIARGDGDSYDMRIRRANVLFRAANFQPHDFDRLFNQAMSDNQELRSRVDYDFFIRRAGGEQQLPRQEIYTRGQR